MEGWSKGEIITLFSVIFTVIGIIVAASTRGSRVRNTALVIMGVFIVLFISWLGWTLSQNIGLNARLHPPGMLPFPSPSASPSPLPTVQPTPTLSPTPIPTTSPTREPTPAQSPTPRPVPAPTLRPRPAPQELPIPSLGGMVTLSFTLLDHSMPVTGGRVEFSAPGFSTTTYTRNGRATATVPCGVPGMLISFEYEGMRSSVPIIRGLKCQTCHFEAGPIDLGIPGMQCLEIRCGGSRTGCG
ncbi:MAG: hypothetical protein QOE33_489 [Acidobacteriota bacterium]|nr:hypothetical protein [Acidobacteriota bacterium]